MNRIKILAGTYDLELLIGAIKKVKDSPAGDGYELAFRWDEDMLIRKLKSKMCEKFWNDFKFKRKDIISYKPVREAFEKFVELQGLSVKEIVDEFIEEVNATKVK